MTEAIDTAKGRALLEKATSLPWTVGPDRQSLARAWNKMNATIIGGSFRLPWHEDQGCEAREQEATIELIHFAISNLPSLLAVAERDAQTAPKAGHVYVDVSGVTASGKSAVLIEIVAAMRAIGLTVETDEGYRQELHMGFGDTAGALAMYNPTVVIRERNISRTALSPAPESEKDSSDVA